VTEFETQSLVVAKETLTVYQIGAGIACAALLASIVAAVVAYRTFQAIVSQLESAKWNMLLSFEKDIASRRDRFQSLARELETAPVSASLPARMKEAIESYLNAVERLSSSILNGQFPELEMKQSYRDYIASTIKQHPEHFQPGTAYRKTLQLHEKWSD